MPAQFYKVILKKYNKESVVVILESINICQAWHEWNVYEMQYFGASAETRQLKRIKYNLLLMK